MDTPVDETAASGPVPEGGTITLPVQRDHSFTHISADSIAITGAGSQDAVEISLLRMTNRLVSQDFTVERGDEAGSVMTGGAFMGQPAIFEAAIVRMKNGAAAEFAVALLAHLKTAGYWPDETKDALARLSAVD